MLFGKRRFAASVAVILIMSMLFSTVPVYAKAEMPDVKPSQEAKDMVSESSYEKGEMIMVYDEDISQRQINKSISQKDCDLISKTSGPDDTTIALVEYSDQDSAAEALTRAENDSRVLYAQPNYIYNTCASSDKSGKSGKDPYDVDDRGNQWYLYRVNAKKAWELLKDKAHPVRVGIVDTGVDTQHKDLQDILDKNASTRITSTGTLYPITRDSTMHGTHVLGIIGGTYNNGIGIAGIASGTGQTKAVMASIGVEGYMSSIEICRGVDYVAKQDVKVINLSLGGFGRDYLVADYLKKVTNEDGILVCAAAGNEADDAYSSPSDDGEVLSVMATDWLDRQAYFSNYGIDKDISAPGEDIISAVPDNEYAPLDGTSMATPIVAAVASMCFSANPDLTPYQVKNILMATARDINTPGYDVTTGYGCVDAEAAVKAALDANSSVSPESIDIRKGGKNLTLDPGDDKTLDPVLYPATCLKDIKWTSSNRSVATVDQYGNVKALRFGSAKITAACGNVSATYNVSVSGNEGPASIEMSENTPDKLCVGDSYAIKTNVGEDELGERLITWTCSDPSVIDVYDDGNILALAPGTATVTAELYNGLSCSKTITVTPAISSVKISNDLGKKKFKVNDRAPVFSAEITPEESAHKKVTFESTNRKVMQIDADTGQTIIKGKGTANILALVDGKTMASVTVTVTGKTASGEQEIKPLELLYVEAFQDPQFYADEISEYFLYDVEPRKYYSEAIWSEIESACKTYVNRINEDSDNAYKHYIEGRAILYHMSKLTKKNMRNKNLSTIKKQYRTKINKLYKNKMSKGKYTTYWQNRLDDNRYIANNNIKNASGYSEVFVTYGVAKANINQAVTKNRLKKQRKAIVRDINQYYRTLKKNPIYNDFSDAQKEQLLSITEKYRALGEKALFKSDLEELTYLYYMEIENITG